MQGFGVVGEAGALLLILIGLAAGAGCHHRPLDLAPPDAHPVFRVEVDDGEEAALLQQRLGITPLRSEGRSLYFADADGAASKMASFGYAPQPLEARDAYFRIVEVRKKGDEKSLLDRGLLLLRRERSVWVLRGSLAQLEALQRDGYRLAALSGEPQPRRAVLKVAGKQVDIVVRSGIDIVDSSGDRRIGFTITVRGFDYELDRLRAAGVPVALVE